LTRWLSNFILFSSLLPAFQGKPYLWAVFKRRKSKVATMEAQQGGKARCAQDLMGTLQPSYCSVGKEGYMVAGLNTVGPEAPEEVERQANTLGPATKTPTIDDEMSANDGQIHSSLVVSTSALFGFVAQRTPRLEQLIQELQREGAVVVAMRGEMIGPSLGEATATGRKEDEMPPSSSGRVAMV
jgi:hypothetical protein